MEQLRASYRVAQEHIVMRLSGRLTMLTMDQFKRAISEAADSTGLWRFVIDASGADFIDSNGLGALLAAAKQASANGGYLRLLNTSPGFQETLRITRLENMFPHYRTLDEALGMS
jgi:anti-sigma B factor antagonist